MAKRPITKELYNAMLEAFREQPGNQAFCARRCGIDRRTAKRGWELGFKWAPESSGCRRPLRDALLEEQEMARVRLLEQELQQKQRSMEDQQKREVEQRQKALMDVSENRMQEAQLIRYGRMGCMALINNLTKLAGATTKSGDKVKATIERMSSQPELSPAEAMAFVRLLGTLTSNLQQAMSVAGQAMQMERLLLGEPGQIVQVQAYGQDVTLEEAERRIRAANAALDSFRGKVVDVNSASLPGVAMITKKPHETN